MKENLHELNPDDTEGVVVEKSVAEFIADDSCKWGNEFSLIIGTDLDNATVKKVAERCAKDITEVQACIPFVLIRQYGLIGYMRIIVDEVAVAEQKPFQVAVRDLRVNEPFPELLEYVNSVDMDKMPIEEHGHTPWVVVIIKAANKWVAEKG